MLVLLLIAHGWCVLYRDLHRGTSACIAAAVTALYLSLALNFLLAGNAWWLVGGLVAAIVGYAYRSAHRFVQQLAERVQDIEPDSFAEMHSQAVHTKGIFVWLERIILGYLAGQLLHYSVLTELWQGPHAWKAQVFQQVRACVRACVLCLLRHPRSAALRACEGSGGGGCGGVWILLSPQAARCTAWWARALLPRCGRRGLSRQRWGAQQWGGAKQFWWCQCARGRPPKWRT